MQHRGVRNNALLNFDVDMGLMGHTILLRFRVNAVLYTRLDVRSFAFVIMCFHLAVDMRFATVVASVAFLLCGGFQD